MDNYENTFGGRKKKLRKRPKKLSEYNKFVRHYMKQGVSMIECAALWRKHKRSLNK